MFKVEIKIFDFKVCMVTNFSHCVINLLVPIKRMAVISDYLYHLHSQNLEHKQVFSAVERSEIRGGGG